MLAQEMRGGLSFHGHGSHTLVEEQVTAEPLLRQGAVGEDRRAGPVLWDRKERPCPGPGKGQQVLGGAGGCFRLWAGTRGKL